MVEVVNKLQDAMNKAGLPTVLDLPQIAVIGGQSAGKSSVLEALVGRDFLPRGTGIVTRRPLVLQLERGKAGEADYCEFLHLPGRRFTDFHQVRDEINNDTAKVCGSNKGISNLPINLKVVAPHTLPLTLVDLPGLTKVAVGDQPKDIERQIRELLTQYIKQPSCLILAVSEATQDIANSDAIQIARSVDPDGLRTLGVLTKVDLMDKGTSIRAVLLNQVVPLHHGYIAVVNQGQAHVKANRPLSEARKEESVFFERHPDYSDVASRCGTPFLAWRLNALLTDHIKAHLPRLRMRVEQMVYEAEEELQQYDEIADGSKASKGAILIDVLSNYAREFCALLDGSAQMLAARRSGRNPTAKGRAAAHELLGGSRIQFIFDRVFQETLFQLDGCDGLTDAEILVAIRNSRGARNTLFVPEIPFEQLVVRQIERLASPSLQCIQLVYQEMLRIMVHAEENVGRLRSFVVLKSKILDYVSGHLRERLEATTKMVVDLVDMEKCHVNATHPDFVGGSRALSAMLEKHQAEAQHRSQEEAIIAQKKADEGGVSGFFSSLFGEDEDEARRREEQARKKREIDKVKTQTIQQKIEAGIFGKKATLEDESGNIRLPDAPAILKAEVEADANERLQIDCIRVLLSSYFAVVRKTIADMVPKTIVHMIVNHMKVTLQGPELVRSLYDESLVEEVLQEAVEVQQLRKQTKERMAVLTEASKVLRDAPLAFRKALPQPLP